MTTYIGDSDIAFPGGGDQRNQCPAHLREAKQEWYDTIPLTGAVSATHTELSYLDGAGNPLNTWMAKVHTTDTYSNGYYWLDGTKATGLYFAVAPPVLVVKFHSINSGHVTYGFTKLRFYTNSGQTTYNTYTLKKSAGEDMAYKAIKTAAYVLYLDGTDYLVTQA